MRLHSLEVLEEDIGKHDTENEKQLRNDDVEDSSSWLLSESAEWQVQNQVQNTDKNSDSTEGNDEISSQRLAHQIHVIRK